MHVLDRTLLYASTDPIPADHRPDPNMYEPFRLMNDSITQRVEHLMDDDSAGSAGSNMDPVTWSL